MKSARTIRRARRTRAHIKGSQRPRLSVFRSNRYIYGQVIDDAKGVTLASASTRGVKKTRKTDAAFEMGKELAKRAREAHVETVAFDKGPYRYHGRVRRVAEGAREGGLKF